MVVAAIILYGAALVCFILVAGKVATRINMLGLGLACCALLWFIRVFFPAVT